MKDKGIVLRRRELLTIQSYLGLGIRQECLQHTGERDLAPSLAGEDGVGEIRAFTK